MPSLPNRAVSHRSISFCLLLPRLCNVCDGGKERRGGGMASTAASARLDCQTERIRSDPLIVMPSFSPCSACRRIE